MNDERRLLKRWLVLWLMCLLVPLVVFGQVQVRVDGNFSEWDSLTPSHIDPLGDMGPSLIDFGKMWVQDDTEFLFLQVEVGTEINLQSDNEIQLFLDTDNDASTGVGISGIGAEILYTLGERTGFVYVGNNSQMLYHDDIGLVSAPTVSSERFEIVIRKSLTFFGQPLFQGDTVRILLKDNSGSGDRTPESSGGIAYELSNAAPAPLPDYFLSPLDSSHLRLLSYNVLNDGLFEQGRAAPMGRILQAIQPDIIGFQEIYNHGALQVATEVETLLPSGPTQQWYFGKEGPDIIAISRYPILDSYPIGNNGAFLLDLEAEYGQQLLLIVAHPPCCGNDQGRQNEIDEMMAFVRDAKAGTGAFQLDANTPILLIGDMNLVGFQRQLQTLLTGNILNNGTYGPDFVPDWDSTALEDAQPYVTGLPMSFTWFNENSSFSPGRLDYIVYSGAVLEMVNAFTLFTRALPLDSLTAYGLQAEDAILASDHLPVVSDFRLDNLTGTAIENHNERNPYSLLSSAPNPFSQTTTISYHLPTPAKVRLSIFTTSGAEVLRLVDGNQAAGPQSIAFQNPGLASGIYFLELYVDDAVFVEKLLIAR